MTQLTEPASPSIGKLAEFEKLTWLDFVGCVLKLTVEAYQAMRRENVVQRNWEENIFTLQLEDYLRPIAYDNEFPIFVRVREKVHTPEMRAGQQATIEAQEIDMSMFPSWERSYYQRRFVWEAKKVGDKRVDRKYSRLNSEYVNEGIYRFIRGEYASGLNDAGMLGYVLAGRVCNIVGDINASMGNIHKNPPLSKSNHLQEATPIGDFEDIYFSNHMRMDETGICLHHLFLKFEFS